MRRGILGSLAALAAGAGTAWGQTPTPAAPAGGPAAIARAGDVIQAQGPAPVNMPPVTVGPPGDPLGMGPTAGLGPPPGPMWPPPGPYTAPLFQPAPPGGGGGGGGGGSGYGTAPRFWFEGNYMLGFVTPQPVPYPLLTTSSPNQNGVIGQPTTISLIPAQSVNYGVVSGFRLGGGFYGDADRRLGFDITSFSLGERTYSQRVTTDGSGSVGIPLLARPYIDANTGLNDSLVLISPTIAANGQTVPGAGVVRFNTSTEAWGIDPSGIWNVFRSSPGAKCWFSLDLIAGYRHLEVNESLEVTSTSLLGSINPVPIYAPGPFGVPVQIGTQVLAVPFDIGGVTTNTPATVTISDRFTTTNRFNGGNFGARAEIRYGMFSLTTTGKIAVGNMYQQLRVRGVTAFNNPVANENGYAFGGVLANASNIGTFSDNRFSVIPELNANLAVNLTRTVTMFVGYNVIYVDNVIRPGSQINPVVNPSVIPFSAAYGGPGAGATPPVFVQKEYWIHGVNFGFQIRY